MFKKIIHILTNLHKVPIKIFNKLKFFYYKSFGNKEFFVNKQIECFSNADLDWTNGKKKLNEIKKKFDIPDREMSSEHEIIFSSISLNRSYKIKEILEIGTFDGINAFLLSKIFPDAKIDTIDLSNDDYDFKTFYNRKHIVDNFIEKRDSILNKSKNINFIQMNSLQLMNYKKKYDLIWIDGAHGYPVVCIDIINSLKISEKNGIILCDDVYVHRNHGTSDKMYKSNATHETLDILNKQNLINYKLIYKRISPEYNCIENEKKFIAFCSKND